MLNLFSFHLISSHRSFSLKLFTHCHRSLCHPISSQLILCLLSFFTSSHLISSDVFSPFLIPSQLISSYPSFSRIFTALVNFSQLFAVHVILSQLIWCHFVFFEINLLSRCFMVVHLMSQHLISHQFFLTLAIHSLSQTQQDTAAALSMQTTRKLQSSC